MRRKVSWTMLIILFLTCTAIGSIGISKASSGPVIRVDPPTSTALVGETFNINISVAGVTSTNSLYGWEIELKFNPSVLKAVAVAEGPFLKAVKKTMFYPPYINNTAGFIVAGALLALPFPEVGAVGSGVLATITFEVLAKGISPLHFEYTELDTIKGGEPAPIEHTAVDGLFALYDHDVAVTGLAVPTTVTLGDVVSVSVTVVNQGCYNESVSVTTYCDDAPINTTAIDMLLSGESEIVEFSWNTTGLGVGVYTINATATIALDEDPGDNSRTATMEIKPFVFHVPELDFNVIVDSNSTLSDFEFREGDMEIRFTVSGPSSTTGYCNVAIPMDKMTGNPWTILVGGEMANVFQSDNGTHTFLYFTYTHSLKTVIIRGTWVVPEFPTPMLLLLVLAILAASITVLKRRTGSKS